MTSPRYIAGFLGTLFFLGLGSSPALAQWGGYGGGHMGPGMMGGWGMGWLGVLFNVVLWVAVIVGVVLLIRWLIQASSGRGSEAERAGGSRALDILKERYARGEIEKEEFEQKKRDLGG